jgi:hypothetical protein
MSMLDIYAPGFYCLLTYASQPESSLAIRNGS